MPNPSCPSPCNVLLLGNGGREHALAWRLRQSPRLGALWLANPGNAGLDALGRACPEPMDLKNAFQMKRWCDRNDIHLVVVGPEGPLAAGIVDALAAPHRQVFGPTREAARLEADKAFAKQVMRHAAIPTAEARVFTDPSAARRYVEARDEPFVVKATGLCAGKGVVVCDDLEEALGAIDRMMVRAEFGDAGRTVMIEERMSGPEVSVLAFVDGRTIWVMDPCQDHKRVGEGDTGPNTGGMGAYCPTPVIDDRTLTIVEREILVPTVDALRRDGVVYRGVLYAGIMLTPAGPKVLEFNCRFGDPECQPLMLRLRSDLVELLWATCTGALDEAEVRFDPRPACCVVMCSAGYPGAVEKGAPIEGLDKVGELAGEGEEIVVFHAGTARGPDGSIVTSGGRVLGVTAMAGTLEAARDLANRGCDRIAFPGAHFRRDIGAKAAPAAGRPNELPTESS
ncbi:MAG: phosphoribosylamine--glycine ligase [Phycisphaerales bacterium]|nr:phosphoribosylamine--glycine ligase [Phycisphaerales bacterium]